MIKVGQIYKEKTGCKWCITKVGALVSAICDDGTVCFGKLWDNYFQLTVELIAEYPTWQEAVNSKEFKGE